MMKNEKLPEVWQRGPVEGVPAMLQPVAHALMQAVEEVNELMEGYPDGFLYQQVAGVASPAFHLKHMAGVLDRLFAYARDEKLTDEQLQYLQAEDKVPQIADTSGQLVQNFNAQVSKAIAQLKQTDEQTITEVRGIGRAQIPSTVIGLLVHAAEHTMRHLGQLRVTVTVIKNMEQPH